jgi:hypothetical protein
MGRLSDLRLSLGSMSNEQKLQRIREIRQERKINRNPVKEKKARQAKKVDLSKIAKALEGMSEDEIRRLLA